MITYHNSGNGGREYSLLTVARYCDDQVELKTPRDRNVLLSRDQVAHLRDALTKWLGDIGTVPSSPPMIEGDTL